MLFLAFLSLAAARKLSVTLVNQCPSQTIWPAVLAGAPADPQLNPLKPGTSLKPLESLQLSLSLPWISGRIWGKQYCSADGTNCLIGDCGSADCWNSPANWTTLFEITVDTEMYYNFSLIEGLSLGMIFEASNLKCRRLECKAPPHGGFDRNGLPICPPNNRVYMEKTRTDYGNIIGCLSDCRKHPGVPEYCCPTKEWRDNCTSTNPWLKAACPQAYSFAFDDKVLDPCKASDFTIRFLCPDGSQVKKGTQELSNLKAEAHC